MYGRCLAVVAAALILGCVSQYHVQDADAAIRDSPKIELLVGKNPGSRTAAENIGAYYHSWTLTRPDAVKNRKELFVMGEPSAPEWRYDLIASLEIAQRTRDDVRAMATLRSLASDLGGDALIDLRRAPMIDRPQFGAKILGFKYLAIVVRRRS